MLSTAVRRAQPLSTRARMFAINGRAQRSAPISSLLGLSPSPRPSPAPATAGTYSRTTFSTKPPLQPKGIDKDFEKEVAQKKLEPRPEEVTTQSSVRHVMEQSQAPPEQTPDVMVDLKNDLNTVKETFALGSVPRENYALGLAGTLPYLATSLSTVFLSWNLNIDYPTKSLHLNSLLFDHDAATYWLQVLEPIQVGYGAVIVSFLGAIHWGLELAEKQPARDRTRFRYAIGVLAPAVAWPTIFMPTVWALTTQFGAFGALYFADARATAKGWAPPWYQTYRFVLTAVVGVALMVSLLGRAKVGEGHPRLSKADIAERLKGNIKTEDYRKWAKEEEKEKERVREEKKKEEERRKEAEKKAKEEEQKNKEQKGDPEKSEHKSGSEDKDSSKSDDKQKGGEQQDGKQKEGEKKDGGKKDGEKKDGEQKDGAQKDGAQKDGAQKDGAQKDGEK
ncbi:uncharacterized protein B0T15DRAFT_503125 [Chaetomium strumarium]|uniref:Mitochondrial inner membrane protein 1 protein n=1 Tax=Chaetomium strumarium TaxID=1170767 RepID=A0AAJ0GU24_9PEZI|nr:hypothetical protein B0T15DRAFT_503125 [Chaetomium strumarium]